MTRHWEPGVPYNTGEILEYQGQRYRVIQGHSSQDDWAPGPATAALFGHLGSSKHHEPPKQHHEPPKQHHEPPKQHHEPPKQHHEPPEQHHEHHHEQHHEPHHEPCHEHEHPQVPAQNTNPPNPPQNPPTPKSNPLSGRDRWLQDAQQHTDEFNRNGPRAPAAWVLTSGREIPGGAFEAGKEGDKTLYVARAYVEDGLYVGKAGKHLEQGAEIGRQHKSYDFTEYEILIADPRAVRWVEAHGMPNPHNFGARHVDAGVDVHGYQIFITQVSHNGSIHPARANSGASGAYLAYGDHELAFQEYRVLCYA